MSMTLGRQPAAEPGPTTPAAPAPARFSRANVATGFLIALPALLLVYVWVVARCTYSEVAVRGPAAASASDNGPDPNGIRLYAQHCARCHGARGTADGATSPYLDPPARRFGEEKFMLVSTENGIPTDDDLHHVLRHGILGTAMPPFDHLAESERQALVNHIRWMTRTGLYARLYQRAKKQDPEDIPDVAELSTLAEKQSSPGAVVDVPAEHSASTSEAIARGSAMFTKNCATCHGPKGGGDGPQVKDMKNENGRPTRPRDLARGVFKGGDDPRQLYLRIAIGMPGTPMPGSKSALKPEEMWDLVHFVRSLSDGRDPDGRP